MLGLVVSVKYPPTRPEGFNPRPLSQKWIFKSSYLRLQPQKLQIHTSGSAPLPADKQRRICLEEVHHTSHIASHGHLGYHAHAHNGWNFSVGKEVEICLLRWWWSWTLFVLKHGQTKMIRIYRVVIFHSLQNSVFNLQCYHKEISESSVTLIFRNLHDRLLIRILKNLLNLIRYSIIGWTKKISRSEEFHLGGSSHTWMSPPHVSNSHTWMSPPHVRNSHMWMYPPNMSNSHMWMSPPHMNNSHTWMSLHTLVYMN